MRFRCSSTSSDVLDRPSGLGKSLSRLTFRGNGNDPNTAGPSNPKRPSRKAAGTRRKRSGVSTAKKEDIGMAMKKAAHQKQLRKHDEWPHIFVGNIKPTVNESDLHKLFTRCGTVIRIQIRCSRGGAVTIGQPMTRCTDRDLQYATIEFSEEEAVRKALRFHGMALHGTQLVVSASAADLPEVKDIVHRRLNDTQERRRPSDRRKVRLARPKPITLQATELVFDGALPQPDRHRIMGYSFAKCVM